MDKLTIVTGTHEKFQEASPMPSSKSTSTHAATEAPPWSIMTTNQIDTVVVRVVTRKTRLRRETTTSNEP